MSYSALPSGEKPKKNSAFILRFVWDDEAEGWLIQLKPTNGRSSRLFTHTEALLLYLEFLTGESDDARTT